MTLRQERWNELLRRLAATFIERESNRDALISVTRVELNEKLDHATIFISVLPESKEEASLHFIERQLTDMRTYIKKNVSTRILPYLKVELDYGEKNRQIVDQIDTTK